MQSVFIQFVSGKVVMYNRVSLKSTPEYFMVREGRFTHYYHHKDIQYIRVEHYDEKDHTS